MSRAVSAKSQELIISAVEAVNFKTQKREELQSKFGGLVRVYGFTDNETDHSFYFQQKHDHMDKGFILSHIKEIQNGKKFRLTVMDGKREVTQDEYEKIIQFIETQLEPHDYANIATDSFKVCNS